MLILTFFEYDKSMTVKQLYVEWIPYEAVDDRQLGVGWGWG